MKRIQIGVVAATALVGIAVGAQSAIAQTPAGGVGAPQQRQERPDDRTPATRTAEDYKPKGVPVGSFRLFPELELNEVYNDNIYATSTGQPGKSSSFIQNIKPVLNLNSDWNNHMLNFFANANFGLYSVDAINNYADFGVGTQGRVDIQRDWNVYGGASFNMRHEDRGTPGTSTLAGIAPNKYNQIPLNIGYYQKFNALSVRADGRLDNYNYTNLGAGPTNGQVWNYQRDRNEWRESLRLGYDFSPGYTVWARGGLNQRNYLYTPDSQGFYRNNYGYDVVGGVAVDLGGITSFEAFAGYLTQYYVDPNFPTIQAPTFGLVGYWNPLKELMVKPYVRRAVEDTSLTTAAAYLSTTAGLDIEYQARPNIKVIAHGDYAWANFYQINNNPWQQDQYLTLRAAVNYDLTRNLFTGLSYQWVGKVSNLANSNYNQNIVMLRLGTRF